jgi:hypothetical protein
MEIYQTLSSTKGYFQPDVPWKNRVCSIEQMVIQCLVRDELVDKQPLRASFATSGTIPDEPDEVGVLHNP